MPEGRQSPDPEQSSGAQQNDPPSNAKGVSQGGSNQDQSKKDLEELTSNPKGPLDDHMRETTSKTVDNKTANSKNWLGGWLGGNGCMKSGYGWARERAYCNDPDCMT